jgi:CheY-specific phosphatase CheX
MGADIERESVDRTDAATRSMVELLASEACVEVFAAHNVTLQSRSEPDLLIEDDSMTGVIGFSGPGIWGMCLLSSSRAPLAASNPVGGSARDWLGELVNQLAGRLKRKLIAEGATVYVTTPIVLRGARIEPLPRHNLRPRTFDGASGSVELWVEVETAADFKLTPEAAETTLSEGDAIRF